MRGSSGSTKRQSSAQVRTARAEAKAHMKAEGLPKNPIDDSESLLAVENAPKASISRGHMEKKVYEE